MNVFISWFAYAFLILTVYCVLEAIYRYRYISKGKKTFPVQTPLPIIGNTLHFFKARTTEGFFRAFDTYLPSTSVSGFWLGLKFAIIIKDANHMEMLLSKGFASKKPDEVYDLFDRYTSGVFSTRDLEKWSKLRKPIDKIMNPKRMGSWMEIFVENSNKFCESVDSNLDSIDLVRLSFLYTMGNLARTHLGLPGLVPSINHGKLLDDLHTVIELELKRSLSLTSKWEPLYKLTENYRKCQAALTRGLNSLNEMFEARIAFMGLNNLGLDESTSFTDAVMKYCDEHKVDDLERARLIADFTVAGTHSTKNVFASAILFLAMHPKYQEKVYEEQCKVLKNIDDIPSYEDTVQMTTLGMVIKETLRLASVTGLGRLLDKDVTLDDYVAPAGSILLFNFLNINRNPKYWEKPLEFYPEHFTPEAEAKRPKGAYLPFGLGVRGCIGKLYSTTLLKVGIGRAVRKFLFTTHLRFENTKFTANVIRSPASFQCSATKRESTIDGHNRAMMTNQ